MNQNQKIILGVVVVIVLVVVGWGIWYGLQTQKPAGVSSIKNADEKLHILPEVPEGMPGMRIENDLNVRTVYFCLGTYKAKQIFIDDVDVIKRISILFIEDREKSDWFCNMMRGRALNEGGVLGNGDELDITIEGAHPSYGISISLSQKPASSFPFFINSEKNTITTIDGGILGSLK